MKVRFLTDHDHVLKARPAVTISYRTGVTYGVPASVGDEVIAKGVAVEVKAKPRGRRR